MPESETIWIIGASEGIGAALAREWGQRGARVIISARSQDRLDVLAAELGAGHIPLALDVSDRNSIDEAAAEISKIGALDRIVHLAAIYDPGKIADLDPDEAAKIVSTNLTGSFHIAQVGPVRQRQIPFPVHPGDMSAIFIGATYEVSQMCRGMIDNDGDCQANRPQ